MFDKSRQLADEATGIPSYTHGVGGVTGQRTASGVSMMMGAAAANIKAVVRNVDDYLLTPLDKALFAFNSLLTCSSTLMSNTLRAIWKF